MDTPETEKEKKKKVKVSPESIKLELFGDIMKFSRKNPRDTVPLKKYDALAVELVAEERQERVLLYKFLCGLALSAHARRTNDQTKRRSLFDLKNKLFLSIANHPDLRKVLNFRFCVSKRFKVTSYCEECTAKNTAENTPQRDWKFCPKCTLDRTYYNVLSMFHKHQHGGASLFLGKEHLNLVAALKPVKHVNLDDFPEQLTFRNYQFTPHNLITLDMRSVVDCANKLLALDEKQGVTLLTASGNAQPMMRSGTRDVGMGRPSFRGAPQRRPSQGHSGAVGTAHRREGTFSRSSSPVSPESPAKSAAK